MVHLAKLQHMSPPALCDRYNSALATLWEAVGDEASRALFLERIEKWVRAVSNFEMVSNPVRALATNLAGDQLERLQSMGNTARGEWRAGRGAKDVTMHVAAQHGSAETQSQAIAAWTALEKWWGDNARPDTRELTQRKKPHLRSRTASTALQAEDSPWSSEELVPRV